VLESAGSIHEFRTDDANVLQPHRTAEPVNLMA
jgi:hypothetical protein